MGNIKEKANEVFKLDGQARLLEMTIKLGSE